MDLLSYPATDPQRLLKPLAQPDLIYIFFFATITILFLLPIHPVQLALRRGLSNENKQSRPKPIRLPTIIYLISSVYIAKVYFIAF